MAYAHEALARAGRVLDHEPAVERHLEEAWKLFEKVSDSEERSMLEADLLSLGTRPS